MRQNDKLYIEYGTTRIPFKITYKERKTLSITVTPDMEVAIVAPVGASMEKILEKIGGKARWISKQIRKFELYEEKISKRKLEYVSGETFFFMGRKYRLKIVEGTDEEIAIQGRYLKVIVKKKLNEEHIAGLVMDWYRQKAKEVFAERLERHRYILKREKIILNRLMVRRLEKRWGSCTERGNIILNLSLVQAPVQCIDYVLVHEVCHLKYLDHGVKFHRILNKYNENWKKIGQRLLTVSLLA